MGFFSWNTNDSKKSISNQHSDYGSFPVAMIDDNNNKYIEENYDGYGVFGGKDYFELIAEMNISEKELNSINKKKRSIGISIIYSEPNEFFESFGIKIDSIKYPLLVENFENAIWKNAMPEDCKYQGYFY